MIVVDLIWWPIEVCRKPGSTGQGREGWEPFASVLAASAQTACFWLSDETDLWLLPMRLERAYHRGDRNEERPWG